MDCSDDITYSFHMQTSLNESSQRQLTVRLSADTLKTARVVARARGLSVNGLIRSLLVELQRAQEEKALEAAYARLGADAESNVEFATREQARVARRG
jgi:hypothetical protein